MDVVKKLDKGKRGKSNDVMSVNLKKVDQSSRTSILVLCSDWVVIVVLKQRKMSRSLSSSY